MPEEEQQINQWVANGDEWTKEYKVNEMGKFVSSANSECFRIDPDHC